MKPKFSSKQSDQARDELVACVKASLAALLTNVPVAMQGLPSSAKWGFALMTVSVVALRMAAGAAVWLVRVKL
jgi:hypothetical protein